MVRLMIDCPNTGKPIPTKMAVYSEAKLAISRFENMAIRCPECGSVHTWNKEDAYLETVDLSD